MYLVLETSDPYYMHQVLNQFRQHLVFTEPKEISRKLYRYDFIDVHCPTVIFSLENLIELASELGLEPWKLRLVD